MALPEPRRTVRPRRLLLLALLLVVGGLVVATLGEGKARNQDDLRNLKFGELYNGNPTQDCWRHHRGEGMDDSHVVIPLFPKQIKVGEVTNLDVQVENSWKHDIAELTVRINMTGLGEGQEPLIVPVGGKASEAVPDLHQAWRGTLGNPNQDSLPAPLRVLPPHDANLTFLVHPRAVALVANLDLYPPEGSAVGNRFEARVYLPSRSTGITMKPDDQAALHRNLTLPTGSTAEPQPVVPGEWRVNLQYAGGDAATVGYSLNVTVVYATESGSVVFQQFRNPPGNTFGPVPVAILKPRGVSDVIHIPVLGVAPGTQTVEVSVRALLWYKHQAVTPNEDWFTRYATVDVAVGDEFVPGTASAVTGGTPEIDFFLVAGEVNGFAAAFLLLPSLLLGGTYGRASRKGLNALLGGAKRRVMFHNLVSLGLTLVALLHIVFFLLEIRYSVLMGVLFGGLGALSLLVLGLTGYYQVPLIQKYGYGWWRVTHLAFGVLVVLFVAYHVVADGPDFFWIKQQLPQWLNDVNLAQK